MRKRTIEDLETRTMTFNSLSASTLQRVCAIAITLIALPVAIAPSANAQTSPARALQTQTLSSAFQPPGNPRRSEGYSTTTGTRQGSCVDNTQTAFTLLGPNDMMGQTTSSHPEFVWHLPPSDVEYPVQFRLLALNQAGIPEPIYQTELSYKEGFSKYQLPTSEPALSVGKEYRWQVVVVCDANYLSRSLNQERAFEVVAPSGSLQQALGTATTDAQRALAHGTEGIWYDAIAQVALSSEPQAKTVLKTLLEDLASVEAGNELLSADIANIAATTAQ